MIGAELYRMNAMGTVEPEFMDTRHAAAVLGLSHRTLEGERRRPGLPPVRQPGALSPVGAGCLGGGATGEHDGAGGPPEGGVRSRSHDPARR